MKSKESFLKTVCGFDEFEILPLKQDASSRKYWRVVVDGDVYVLMDGDAKLNKFFEFVEISKLLNSMDVHAPKVFYCDMEQGLALLEDLGDGTFTNLLNLGMNEVKLYKLAAELLTKVVKLKEKPTFIKDLTPERIVNDICFFIDWYYPLASGKVFTEEKRLEFIEIAKKLTPLAYRVPSSLLLWDYHVDNVMLLKDEKTCAVIDFQDAFWGPLTYDIMTLLKDERRDISQETFEQMKEMFFNTLSGVSREDFNDSFDFFAMFRHMRVLGRFSILLTRGKDAYLQHIPRIWRSLDKVFENPKLKPMKDWLDKNIPLEERKMPIRKPITKAMILAAGRGTRMRELGDATPKPLIEVNGKAMIDYKIESIKEVSIKDIVVNVCWQSDKIIEHLQKYDDDLNIMVSVEEEALETGGGVKNALYLLGDQPFFTLNSDTIWKDSGYKPAMWRMIDKWDNDKYDIILLINPLDKTFEKGRGHGDYRIVDGEFLERNKTLGEGYDYFFSGVTIMHPRVFEKSPDGKFSLRELWDEAESKKRLGYVINTDELFHVGTPEDKAAADKKFK